MLIAFVLSLLAGEKVKNWIIFLGYLSSLFTINKINQGALKKQQFIIEVTDFG